MSRTSTALRRLGVAGLVAATIGAGVPAFFAVSASAATPSLGLTPTRDIGSTAAPSGYGNNTNTTNGPTANTAPRGRECNPFTLTVSNEDPNNYGDNQYEVNITQTIPATTSAAQDTSTATIGFCDATSSFGDYPGESNNYSQETPTNQTPAQAAQSVDGTDNSCTGTSRSTTTSGTTSCTTRVFPNSNGQVTFGVFSDKAGDMSVLAFEDLNNNNAFEPAVETSATATKTFVGGNTGYNANGGSSPAAARSANQSAVDAAVTAFSCTPQAQTQRVGGDGYVTCTASGANGSSVYGANIGYTVTNGPDRGDSGSTVDNGGDNADSDSCYAPSTLTTTATDGSYVDPAGDFDFFEENFGNSNDGTNNRGRATCEVANFNGIGTDTVVLYPGSTNTGTLSQTVQITFSGEARNVDCTAVPATLPAGGGSTTTCRVTDVNGNPVAGQDIRFTRTGVGRIVANSTNNDDASQSQSVAYGFTDQSGNASVQTTSFTNESGTQTVTGEIGDFDAQFGTADANGFTPYSSNTNAQQSQYECQLPANTTNQRAGGTQQNQQAPSTPGTCSDSVTITFQAVNTSASPSASSTATASTSPSASASASTSASTSPSASQSTSPAPSCTPAQQNLRIKYLVTQGKAGDGIVGPVANATQLVTVQIDGATPGGTVVLEAYQQNHFGTATFANAGNLRTAVADSAGVAKIDVRFSSNARSRARMQNCTFSTASNNNSGYSQGNGANGNVLYVKTVITFTVTRVNVTTLRISGDSLPARPGGLIVNVNCKDAKCRAGVNQNGNNPNGILLQPRANPTNGEFGPVEYTFKTFKAGERVTLYATTGDPDTGKGDAQNIAGRSNDRSVVFVR